MTKSRKDNTMKMKTMMTAAMMCLAAFAEQDVKIVKMTRMESFQMMENLRKYGKHEFKKDNVVLIVEEARDIKPYVPTGSWQKERKDIKKFEPSPYTYQTISWHKQPAKKEDA